MTQPNTYGKFWPDTWVVFLGKADSPALHKHNLTIETQLGSNIVRFDSGRALPQPFSAQENGCGIIFDGNLYNKHQLCQQLDIRESDSSNLAALLLKAYRRWGSNFISQLKGCFSFILWDNSQELFWAARDHVGVYPLFRAETDSGHFFSLSIQALLAQPEVPNTINRTVLALYLSLSRGRREETFYQSIERIPCGHLLRFEKGKRERIRYWNPIRPDGNVDWIKETAIEQFETLLEQVSKDFLEFGNAGIYLSGGLDSVAAASFTSDVAHKRSERTPRAYSLVFPNIGEIEEPVQRGVASGLNLPLFITSLEQASGSHGLFQSAMDMTTSWPIPMGNLWRPAYNYLGQHARLEDCQVIITGVGGDEWLGLTPFYAADLIRKLDFPGLYRLIIGMWHSWPFPLRVHIYNGLWKYGARPVIANQAARVLIHSAPGYLRRRRKNSLYRADPDWFDPDPEIQKEISSRLDERVEESFLVDKSNSFYLNELALTIDHPIASMDFEEEFENSRRLGIPILGYYQHQELMDYLFRFPPHLLNTGRPQKGLVREILQKRFPNLGLQKQKKIGATDNFRKIVLEESPAIWEKLGGIKSLSRLGIVNPVKADEFVSATYTNPPKSNSATWIIWHLINYESWLRKSDNL